MMQKVRQYFEAKLRATSDERFWVSTISCLIVGANFANACGLTSIDVVALERFLCDEYDRQRGVRTETVSSLDTRDDALELVQRLINITRVENLLITEFVWQGKGRVPNNDLKYAPTKTAWLQLGLVDGTLRFTTRDFDKWARENGYSASAAYRVMRKHLNGKPSRNVLGSGVTSTVVAGVLNRAQMRCFDIHIPAAVVAATSPGVSSLPD